MNDATKPLYLDGRVRLQVSSDGPALRVRSQCSGDRRFPLQRVSRIVVFGNVAWAAETLSACAAAGTIVCFLRADGLPSGRWVGPLSPRSSFAEDWRHFTDRAGAENRLRQWRVATRRDAIRFCALCINGRGGGTRGFVREVGRCVVKDGQLRTAKRGLFGLAYARSLEELTKVGLTDSDPALGQIAADLSAVIQWGLHPALCDWRRCHADATLSALAAFFERNGSTVLFHLRATLRSLAHLIEEQT